VKYLKEKLLSLPAKAVRQFLLQSSYLKQQIQAASRHIKKWVAIVFDIVSAILTVWMAFSIRLELWHWPHGTQWILYLLAPALMLPFFHFVGLYKAIHRHSGFSSFVTVAKATGYYGLAFFLIVLLLNLSEVPRSIGILQPMIFLLVTGGSRALVRFWFKANTSASNMGSAKEKLLIYGAGSGGAEIAAAILRSAKFELAGFVDDDDDLQGSTVNGMKVFSMLEAEGLIKEHGIHNILLAMPSTSRTRRNEIIEYFRNTPVRIRMLPGIEELADGQVSISAIKDVEIEDLLGRDPVSVCFIPVKKQIFGKVVMVTGAGGSIGSELCSQLLVLKPSMLILVDHAEYNLYTIHSDLEHRKSRLNSETRIVPLLCDVTDESRISEICRIFEPAVIYHAAAYKHVPMVEHNTAEGIRNNVLGTFSVAQAALRHGVSSLVLVSTDKAVRPTNVMGASKRMCEMILQALARESGHTTCFSMVRFGNVLGSSGSVVPLFRRQIRQGGPLTITHKDMTRYFMTIPEATQLVIKAGAIATGGTVFLLDMGDPVKIIDLARRMVELSGLTVRDQNNAEGDIEIQVTGLRPGEKLFEELLIGNCPEQTSNSRIFKANEHFLPWSELQVELQELITATNGNDVKRIKRILKNVIPEYQPAKETNDLLAREEERKNSTERFALGETKNTMETELMPNLTILIVEDENTSGLILEMILKGANITILRACNGQEGVDLVESHPEINLVLMDIKMPVMDGFEATRLIRHLRPDLPVVAQTSLESQEDRDKAKEAGCEGYITKPINKNELLELMQVHLIRSLDDIDISFSGPQPVKNNVTVD
jgi:FlaA1/EpsC-like NDP-sugar epimerase/ActR/RegA family two-component response regulator